MQTPHIVFYVLIFTSLITISTVAAQTSTDSSATTTSPVSTSTTDIPTTRETPRRTALLAVAQVRLTNLAANVSNQLDAFIRRLDNVTNRLASRAEKLRATSVDVTAAEAKIRESKAALDTARATLRTIDADVASFVGSTNPKESWQNVRSKYQTARTAIGEAHKTAVEALLLLQAASAEPTSTNVATTTNSVE
jgi:ABC-type transporter Mla subunit MlaD